MGSVFEDMFGSGGQFGDIFSDSYNESDDYHYSHPRSQENIAKIYTFSRSISEIVLKPTTRGSFVILDNNEHIIEEIDEIIEAKIRYIKIVMGDD